MSDYWVTYKHLRRDAPGPQVYVRDAVSAAEAERVALAREPAREVWDVCRAVALLRPDRERRGAIIEEEDYVSVE